MTTPSKAARRAGRWTLIILPVVEAAVFCLYWNVLGTHSAVGLGTVNYWTALGVDLTASTVLGALTATFWWSGLSMRRLWRSVNGDE